MSTQKLKEELEPIDYNLGLQLIDAHNYKLSDILPADWSEKYRVMSSDVSTFPGKYSYERTPYLREIINHLSLESPARVIAVMKGAQIGFSTGVIENGIGWIISQAPAPILLTSGDKELSKEMMEKRIDQMIDSCGLRHLIRPNSMRKRNQRTGDTSQSKEFPGGFLIADGTNNANKLRQRSFMYGFVDDFEAAPQSDKKAGSTRNLIEQRFASYYSKMKLFYISTPEIKQTSNIEPVYMLGDQRKFHLPCPKCGGFIDLQWKTTIGKSKDLAGITFKLDSKGRLLEKSVGYTCQLCGEFFRENHKWDMLQAGEWFPTAEPSEIGYYSYHISALYAPPGMYNWTHYVRKWIDCYPGGLTGSPDTEKLKSFLNVALGQTYEIRGKSPQIKQLQRNTRRYKVGEVPNLLSIKDGNGEIVLLTCSCDLNGKQDDARLDYEVLAWSENGSTYSIDAGSIGTFEREKSTEERELWTYRNNQPLNVWETFAREVLQREYISDDGHKYTILAAGIDTGYFTNFAYTFVSFMRDYSPPALTIGLKGETTKIRKVDADSSIYKLSRERNDLYVLDVNKIKDDLTDQMQLLWNESSGYPQPPGFMNYPQPEDNKYTTNSYFSHYEGEQKVEETALDGHVIGYKWIKKHSSVKNHFWDCRIYNIAIKDIFVDEFLKSLKIKYGSWGDFCRLIKGK